MFLDLMAQYIVLFIVYTAILRMFEMYKDIDEKYDGCSNYERYIMYLFPFSFQLFFAFSLNDFYFNINSEFYIPNLIIEINNEYVKILLFLFGYIGIPIFAFIYHLYLLKKKR